MKADRRMRRTRDLILGPMLLVVGAVILVLALVVMQSPNPFVFGGGIGVGASAIAVGWFRIVRGFRK